MKKSRLKEIIKEEISSLYTKDRIMENQSPSIQSSILADQVLMDMRIIHKIPQGNEEKFLGRFLPKVENLKKSLTLLRVDHPSLDSSYKYVIEILMELENNPTMALKALGGGEIIKEFINIVYKPIRKVVSGSLRPI